MNPTEAEILAERIEKVEAVADERDKRYEQRFQAQEKAIATRDKVLAAAGALLAVAVPVAIVLFTKGKP